MENYYLNALTTLHYNTYHEVATFYSIIISNMFLRYGIIVVRLRRSNSKPRVKGFYSVNIKV
jgi:hypothetical protein